MVSPSSRSAATFAADLQTFGPGTANGSNGREGTATGGAPHDIRIFPRYDTPPYDRFSPQPFVVAQRMHVLFRWLRSAEADAHDDLSQIAVEGARVVPREVLDVEALRAASSFSRERFRALAAPGGPG